MTKGECKVEGWKKEKATEIDNKECWTEQTKSPFLLQGLSSQQICYFIMVLMLFYFCEGLIIEVYICLSEIIP